MGPNMTLDLVLENDLKGLQNAMKDILEALSMSTYDGFINKLQVLRDRNEKVMKCLQDIEDHKNKLKKLKNIENSIQEHKEKITQLVSVTFDYRTELQRKKKEIQALLSMKELMNDMEIDEQELLAYAQRLSFTTAAPINWDPSQPLGKSRPPHPQEDEMLQSSLYQQIPSDCKNDSFLVFDSSEISDQVVQEPENEKNDDTRPKLDFMHFDLNPDLE